MNKIYYIIGFSLIALQLFAQAKLDSSNTQGIEYAYYPMAFYTPETQFAVGAGALAYTRLGITKKIQLSKVQFLAYYTTNKQYTFSIMPTLYFDGKYRIISESKLIYSKEVAKFYGVGNNTSNNINPGYIMGNFRFYSEASLAVGLLKNFHTGIILEYTSNKIIDREENTKLITNSVIGSNGGNTSGLGLFFMLDNRDNTSYPTKNNFLKFRMIFFDATWGSNFTYSRLIADYRQYQNLGNSHIISGQIYLESTSGSVPFFKLPALGGANRMRGYFFGRYRDEAFLTCQAEYRKIIWERVGAVVFLGMGDVAKKLSQFKLSQFKYSYGVGLRVVFDKKEKINMRMDLGFGKNTNGIYFSLEEAF